MRRPRPWWRLRRLKHRDAVVLCVLSSALLLAGELTVPVLGEVYAEYLLPARQDPPLLAFRVLLAGLAFTTALGAVLVLAGGWAFLVGRVGRGRFLVGLGVGLTSITFLSKLAYATLVYGTPLAFLVPLATSLTGLGILAGLAAHTLMGQYALLMKKRAAVAWRRWRRDPRVIESRRSRRGTRRTRASPARRAP